MVVTGVDLAFSFLEFKPQTWPFIKWVTLGKLQHAVSPKWVVVRIK